MTRSDGRTADQLRSIDFEKHFSQYAEGSILARFGQTHVLCNVTLDEKVPNWLRRSPDPHGWLTAEYAMLPRSTQRRVQREVRWPKGRSQEISRLIGRSLRMAVDLYALGQRQLIVDCDVLQADGGTRTAAISGAWVAVNLALRPLIQRGELPAEVLKHQITAISVGIVDGASLLDLAYDEDVTAEVDLNVVMTAAGDLVEVQGTAEKAPFPRASLAVLLDVAAAGIDRLGEIQRQALERA